MELQDHALNKLKVNTFQDKETNMFYRTRAGGGTGKESVCEGNKSVETPGVLQRR